jgi:hypothetical protein
MHCTLDWGQRAHSCLHYVGLCTSFDIPIPYITFVILIMKLLPFCFLLRSPGPQQLDMGEPKANLLGVQWIPPLLGGYRKMGRW